MNASPQAPVIAISANTGWALCNYRINMLRALQAEGFTLAALVPEDDFSATLRAEGVAVHPIAIDAHGTSPLNDLRLLASYFRLFRKLRPVAYLGFTIKPNIYGSIAAAAFGIPTLNGVTGLGAAFGRSGGLQSLVRGLYRLAFRKSRRVFFENRDNLELFLSLGLLRKEQAVHIHGGGIDLDWFAPRPRPAGDRPFTFLLASRLLWAKGVGEYCAAARWFRDNRPGPRFQLLGPIEPGSASGGIGKDQIDRWQQECAVDYLGGTSDVRPYLAAADCVVLPSYYPEGLPRVLIEAAAMARPIVTTDTPGCRDSVIDRETGILCEPRSVESLVEAMQWMLDRSEEERAAMGRRARDKAEREFDERLVIDRYLAEVRSIVSEGR